MTMKHERGCTYLRREEALVAHLYDEGDDPVGRVAFESHLATCRVCRDELDGLRLVRSELTAWAPPEPQPDLPAHADASAIIHRLASASTPARTGLTGLPWWLQTAAAVLCVGVGLGAANLRVHSGQNGLTVRTGWLQFDDGITQPAPDAAAAETAATADSPAWRHALVALEQDLRAEIKQASLAPPSPGPTGDRDAVSRQVRGLVAESERRQQRELALRIADLTNDLHAQRIADLSKIDRSLGLIQNSTGIEVLRQREMINSLAYRVSGQQRP